MRRYPLLAVVLALALAAAACGENDTGDNTNDLDAPSSTTPSATTTPAAGPTTSAAPSGPAANLTLRMTGLRLVITSDESDNGLRVLLPAGVATASVTLSGLPSPNQVISVCQAKELDKRLTGATCRTPANGEAVNVALGSAASGIELVQTGVVGGSDSAALDAVEVRYSASSREISARLPQVAAGEAGGKPTFALSPASADGAYRAQLSWTTIPVFGGGPGLGLIEALKGGAAVNQTQSSANAQLTGNVPLPATDAAIRVSNLGQSALVAPKFTALLP